MACKVEGTGECGPGQWAESDPGSGVGWRHAMRVLAWRYKAARAAARPLRRQRRAVDTRRARRPYRPHCLRRNAGPREERLCPQGAREGRHRKGC
ncbi:unnamed protein product, partial [Iphiclides podalirius]